MSFNMLDVLVVGWVKDVAGVRNCLSECWSLTLLIFQGRCLEKREVKEAKDT